MVSLMEANINFLIESTIVKMLTILAIIATLILFLVWLYPDWFDWINE